MPAPLKLHPEADPRLAKSFKNFLWKTWQSLDFEAPTPLQYDMATYLQYGGNRKVLMAFRGAAKSYITVPYCLWNLYRDQNYKVLTTSATGGFAANNAQFAYKMISEFEWLAWLQPRPDQRQSALQFDVNGATAAKDASFCAVGMFGQITGRRADLIVPDDSETPNTSDTEPARGDLRRAIAEFGAVIKPNGEITYLGTAQHEETIYLELEAKGYALRMWPAIYPKPDEMKRYGHRLAPMIVKDLEDNPQLSETSTEPGRFSETDLMQREVDFGTLEFDRQFRLWLDAGTLDINPLKLSLLSVLDLTPDGGVPAKVAWSSMKDYRIDDINVDCKGGDHIFRPLEVADFGKPDSVKCYVDPAGSGKDETTWTIAAVRASRVFLLHQGASLEGSSDSVLQEIAEACKKWKTNEIVIESNFGMGMFGALLRPKLSEIKFNVTITEERVGNKQKEVRILDSLQPLMGNHRLIVNAGVLRDDYHVDYKQVEDGKKRFYRLTYQMTRITRTKGAIAHDDRVDGLSGVVRRFIEFMRIETAEAEKDIAARAWDKEIEKLIAARKKQGLPLFGADQVKGALASLHGGGAKGKKPRGSSAAMKPFRGKRGK